MKPEDRARLDRAKVAFKQFGVPLADAGMMFRIIDEQAAEIARLQNTNWRCGREMACLGCEDCRPDRIANLESQLAEERVKRIAAETTAEEAVKQSDEAKGERALSDKMKESWKARALRAEKQSTEERAKRISTEEECDHYEEQRGIEKERADKAEKRLAEVLARLGDDDDR